MSPDFVRDDPRDGSPLDETAGLAESLGVVGPRVVTGRAGSVVRDRWALVVGELEEGVVVEWTCGGRVLPSQEPIVSIAFDLSAARAGTSFVSKLSAALKGSDWRVELPPLSVEVRVEE